MLITADFGASNTGAAVFYTILNADKTVAQARDSTGVTEIAAGLYGVTVADATVSGKVAIWDIDGTSLRAIESFEDMATVEAIKAKTDNLPASPAAVSDIPIAADNAAAVRTNLAVELGRIDATISSRSTASAAAVSVWGATMEDSLTYGDGQRLAAAVLHGNASGLAGSNVEYKSLSGSKSRITATQSTGARTVTERDGT